MIAVDIDERSIVEVLGIDDGGIDVGEELEIARAADVVAVARGPVGNDLVSVRLAYLARLEWLDHPVLERHAADPSIRFDHASPKGRRAHWLAACPAAWASERVAGDAKLEWLDA